MTVFVVASSITCLRLAAGTEIKLRDIKTEPSGVFFGAPYGALGNDSKQGLVSVAITLRPAAAEVRPIKCFDFSRFPTLSFSTFCVRKGLGPRFLFKPATR